MSTNAKLLDKSNQRLLKKPVQLLNITYINHICSYHKRFYKVLRHDQVSMLWAHYYCKNQEIIFLMGGNWSDYFCAILKKSYYKLF